jgi:Mg2+/Co2+ transporter CorB
LNDVPPGAWLIALTVIILIGLSGFFSGSETALMTLNRYRLRNLAKNGHRGAIKAAALLDRPDRLIGLILLGNNFVNILASALATILAMAIWGDKGVAFVTGLLTLVILIFAEVLPKTLATLRPEKLAFFAAHIYTPLMRVTWPVVYVINMFVNRMLKSAGVDPGLRENGDKLNSEELRTVVNEAGDMIPERHQRMLINILDLEKATVDEIMVPRSDIEGIDLNEPWPDIVEQLGRSSHSRMPVYREDIDNVEGFIYLRRMLNFLRGQELTQAYFESNVREAYFIPEGTPVTLQLLNFQQQKKRIGLVVDEYGDIQGLITIEDILEEIVGEFTSDPAQQEKFREISLLQDGTYTVQGSVSLRELNREFSWNLPTDGPKTLNGLVLEHLQNIPETGACFIINGRPIEVTKVSGNVVQLARIDKPINNYVANDSSEVELTEAKMRESLQH